MTAPDETERLIEAWEVNGHSPACEYTAALAAHARALAADVKRERLRATFAERERDEALRQAGELARLGLVAAIDAREAVGAHLGTVLVHDQERRATFVRALRLAAEMVQAKGAAAVRVLDRGGIGEATRANLRVSFEVCREVEDAIRYYADAIESGREEMPTNG